MRRVQKLAFGLALAVAAHGTLFFYGAPQIDGLATVAPDDTLVDEVSATADPAPTSAADARAALDVGWTQPEESPPDAMVLAAPKPLPAPPVAARAAAPALPKPAVSSKPLAKADGVLSASNAGPVIAADSNYANRVRLHLARYAGALPPGANGEARVQFVVQPDGRVSNVLLVKFSGHSGLDSIALNLPTMAQPLPPPGAIAQRLEVPVQAVAAAP